jgi:hypothetical protein
MITRAFAGCAVAISLLATIAIEHVRARASELALDLGPVLLAYAGAARDEGHRTLLVNGARLELRTGVTSDSIDTVLTRQREHCGPAHTTPIVRSQSALEGVLGCFVTADDASLANRLVTFAETGDLATLGELRATWVMNGDDERRYVLIAARDTVALSRMFPRKGDAPGVDVPGLPRPPEATRVLSSFQHGEAPMLVAYRSTLEVNALERLYIGSLETATRHVERAPRRDGPDETALFVRDLDRAHLVLLGRDGDGTLVVIVPLPTQLSK